MFVHTSNFPPTQRLALALDPATPPSQLQELGLSTNPRAVKQAVARNPNTPPEVLLQMAGRYWTDFLENPVLPLLLLEDPGLLHRLPVRALRALVRREGIPPLVLQTLGRHKDREVREGAKYHVAAPEPASPAEAPADWHQQLRRELERLPAARATLPELLSLNAVPGWLLEAVAGTSNRVLQTAVIRAGQEPEASPALQATSDMLRRAVGEPYLEIIHTKYDTYRYHERVGKAPLTPADLARLAQGSRTWQVLAARSPALDAPTLALLARSPHWQVSAALAGNPALTPAVAIQLATRGDMRVLRRLARSRVLPESLLPNLARSADADVRRSVARHPATPAATLARLATDANADVRRTVAANRHTPPDALLALSTDANEDVRERVAYNRAAPEAALEKLVVDKSVKFRTSMARNQRLPPALIRRLYDDPDKEVRHAAFFNPRNPRFILDFIMEHAWAPPGKRPPVPDWGKAKGWMRDKLRLVSLNDEEQDRYDRLKGPSEVMEEEMAGWFATAPQLLQWGIAGATKSPEFLTQLAAHADPQVRRCVADNEHTPLAVLRALANDPKKAVRYGVGASKRVGAEMPDLLVRLATDRKAFVRSAVAGNALTLAEQLDTLTDDADADVRSSAAHNHNAATATLVRLSQQPLSGRLRNAVLGNPNTPLEMVLAAYAADKAGMAEKLAGNPNTPAAILWELAQAPAPDAPDLHATLARNPAAPPELLQWLWDNLPADDMEKKIGWGLVDNPNLSEPLFLRIVAESNESITTFFLNYPRLTPDVLEQAFQLLDLPKKERLVYSAAKHHAVWDRLFDDGEQKVRERLARNKDVPVALLRRLAALPAVGKWAQVGMNLLDNIASPPDVLLTVLAGRATEDAAKGSPWWYAVAVDNRNATAEVIETLMARLAADQDAGRVYADEDKDKIWLNLVGHPLLAPAHLPRFARHPSRAVREGVLQRADCPPALREQMRYAALKRNLTEATSVLGRASALADASTTAGELRYQHPKAGWVERLAMVENPNLPADLLALLTQDAHRLVRAAARERHATGRVPDLMSG